MNTRAKIAFAAISILWGIPYLLIKIAVDAGITPAFLAWSRVVLGAAILLAISDRKGLGTIVRERWKWIALFALAEIVIPFPLMAIGEQHVDSSVAAILVASAPLFVALLALRFDHTERVGGWRLGGLLIGLAGVVMFVGIDFAGRHDELLGALAILVCAFFYAVGPMVLKKKLADLDARTSMGISLVFGAVMLTPLVALDPQRTLPSTAGIGAVVGLGVLCTAAAFVAYGVVIAEAGAGRALVVTYINPVIAIGAGMLVRGERPGAGAVVGLVLILAGSWIATGGNVAEGEAVGYSSAEGDSE
ncbi:MAG TPA: DMT family transporter [Terriglobales bacterium]|nr:DMT family transporter [Terriglobales bacterium]